jgi:hypothetical protein
MGAHMNFSVYFDERRFRSIPIIMRRAPTCLMMAWNLPDEKSLIASLDVIFILQSLAL